MKPSVLEELNPAAIYEHVKVLAAEEKLSGSAEAERAAQYIQSCVSSYGVDCHLETFDAYLSNPVESTLEVFGETLCIACRPRSFSRNVPEGITGELVYDDSNLNAVLTPREVEERLETFRGKIVMSHGFDERYEKRLEAHGVLGLVQVWTSREEWIHEDTVSGVWGTPTPETSLLLPAIPVVGITRSHGDALLHLLEQKTIRVKISAKLETGVFPCVMPVAEIPGPSKDFVLLSCHYDTWYQGAFDNGVANAAAIEIARVLNAHRKELKRGVRIVWWAGHSNGRYAGSTWYSDNHYEELREHCCAHITADLLGARGCTMVGVHTTGVEGQEFLLENIYTVDPGLAAQFFPVGRGADQSFWGCNIPLQFYARYERLKEQKESDSPGPGVPWWHTEHDTCENVDPEILRKDAELYLLNSYRLLTAPRLPFAAQEYFEQIFQQIAPYREGPVHAACEELLTCIRQLQQHTVQALQDASEEEYNRIVKVVGGNMNRVCQSTGSPYSQDLAFSGPPVLSGLTAFLRTAEENETPEQYLFLRTEFIRQKNRVLLELKRLDAFLLTQMYR